jgi:bifunctional non-homologous end joining protein LigD
MIPVAHPIIPEGTDWGYQLKWDGVRLLARIAADGGVELFSRKLQVKNSTYPELAAQLSVVKGPCLLDGEAFVFDNAKQRPVFRKVLTRERMRNPSVIMQAGDHEPVRFAIFDLLGNQGKDWRDQPYRQRHQELLRLFPDKQERLFVTDLFSNGQALWNWVEERGWEGIVAKRLSSPYREGKKHQDWLKRKTVLTETVSIVGYTMNEDRLASLIMVADGLYFGRVSLGLNGELKAKLRSLPSYSSGPKDRGPFSSLPPDLKGLTILWLNRAFTCTVTGLEVTDAGLLRHSKLLSLPEL